MTYARARLWLGICGVGTIVVIATALLVGGVPSLVLPEQPEWRLSDVSALAAFVAVFAWTLRGTRGVEAAAA